MYVNVESLCCTPENILLLYIDYILTKKKKKENDLKNRYVLLRHREKSRRLYRKMLTTAVYFLHYVSLLLSLSVYKFCKRGGKLKN